MNKITTCTVRNATLTHSAGAVGNRSLWEGGSSQPEDPFFGTIAKAATAALELHVGPPDDATQAVRDLVSTILHRRA